MVLDLKKKTILQASIYIMRINAKCFELHAEESIILIHAFRELLHRICYMAKTFERKFSKVEKVTPAIDTSTGYFYTYIYTYIIYIHLNFYK